MNSAKDSMSAVVYVEDVDAQGQLPPSDLAGTLVRCNVSEPGEGWLQSVAGVEP